MSTVVGSPRIANGIVFRCVMGRWLPCETPCAPAFCHYGSATFAVRYYTRKGKGNKLHGNWVNCSRITANCKWHRKPLCNLQYYKTTRKGNKLHGNWVNCSRIAANCNRKAHEPLPASLPDAVSGTLTSTAILNKHPPVL